MRPSWKKRVIHSSRLSASASIVEHLHGDGLVQVDVARSQHHTHSAPSDQTFDTILVGDQVAYLGDPGCFAGRSGARGKRMVSHNA